jgi:hypothetical protein
MYLVLPQVPYEIDTGIKLVLPQIIPGWYNLPYQYSYQYHIPRLHLICKYNTDVGWLFMQIKNNQVQL